MKNEGYDTHLDYPLRGRRWGGFLAKSLNETYLFNPSEWRFRYGTTRFAKPLSKQTIFHLARNGLIKRVL